MLKIACQEGMVPGATLEEKLDRLAAAGYDGVELRGDGLADRVQEVRAAAKNHPVKLATICGGIRDRFVDPDRKEREASVADATRNLQIAGELGMVGVIFVPIFGPPRLPDLHPIYDQISLEKDIFTKQCEQLAAVAEKAGTFVLLEPLNRYETHFIRTLEQAVEIVKRVGNPHMKIMGDFFHMSIEEADIAASLREAAPYLAHCHLADSNRQLPGLGHTEFRSGFAALEEVGFGGYMALECGNPVEDKLAGLRTCADFLHAQMA
jgi:sugar phosphate isomerase/epimerase